MASDALPVEEEDLGAPSPSYVSALDDVKRRCDAQKIEYVQNTDDDGKPYVRIKVRSGRIPGWFI